MKKLNFLYTLAFIKKGDEILMLNRNKQPWQGMWNGVGGKLKLNENPLDSVIREINEETGLSFLKEEVIFKGIVTWNGYNDKLDDTFNQNGLYLYLTELPSDVVLKTPIKTKEGILDWKKINFLNDKDNLGIPYNIPYFINNVINSNMLYQYDCLFNGNDLIDVKIKELK